MKVTKQKMLKIIVHWAEGRRVPKEDVEYTDVQKVENLIQQIAKDELDNKYGGYCKFKYSVFWEEGSQWTARLDIDGSMYGERNVLADDILSVCLFKSGQKKPVDMTEEDYKKYLQIEVGNKQQEYADFINNYEILS
ncbi:hypothetical protein ABD87_22745 [Lysinibacillus sphaericus]|uniref:hypothetical protein n=1 Tax=Lysinibacillus sphaericus TaxID=1421 RepID=UPI0018CCBCDC|nr:hypothetical protein [Lysinibacillus sphaericus]MBG9732246.1 hypothetical protein [Lysinibacillus sphaericus]